MSNKLILLFVFVALSLSVYSQRNCSTTDYLQQQLLSNPQQSQVMQEIEDHTQRFINSPQQQFRAVVTIPVVVHVIYNNNSENISDAQIQSQIDVLNEDFRRTNGDANGTWPQAADTEIQFCLASVDPNGNATTGITRTSTSLSSFSTNDNMKFTSQGGRNAWPSGDYMNFWVCDLSGSLLGYAQFPGGAASTDGIVVDYAYFGRGGSAQAPFNLGRTGTHEVGHWLNLRHIWGDGGCSVDDFVSDTPVSDASNGGCASNHVSCGSLDMVQNYMDYSDDACMNLFTAGQKARMQALFAPGGARASLLNSAGCGSGNTPTCNDGIQNQGETGVDCGGPCPACPPVATCNDGIQNQGETGVDCGGPCPACPTNCNGNELVLTITLDDYPEETSWVIRNASGTTVESGGTYGSIPDGTTITVDVCLPNGCYDFVINDSYGDGICCSYGNGSYSLADGGGVLASGGSFGASETTNFCVGAGPAPTCNDGIQNQGETGVDCGGPCPACPPVATCNDGIQNQGETGVDCGGPCPACPPAPTCNDGIQNQGETGVDCGGPCPACPTGGSTVLSADYFETGWDGWADGGSDCYRYFGTRSYEGSYSIRLRDNSGTGSSMTSSNYNLAAFSSVEVNFYFYPRSMENGEDFWLRYNDGSGWQTVASWARGSDFNNNTFYQATVTLDNSNVNLANGAQFRFQCDASVNNDQVYIDQVTITGFSGGNRSTGNTIALVGNSVERGDEFEFEGDFAVYPNPASDYLNVVAEEEIRSIRLYSLDGRLLQEMSVQGMSEQLDISRLNAGLYIVELQTEEELLQEKFIKH